MSRLNKFQKYEKLVIPYLEKNPDLKPGKLAKIILEEHPNLNITAKYFADAIGVIRKKYNIKELKLEENIIPDQFEIKQDYYIIRSTRGEIKISIEEADELFYEYSKHGLNLSSTAIKNKHDIGIWQWHCLKRALCLYKDSNIFSPYTIENTPKGQLANMIEKKMEFKESDKKRLVEDTHNKVLYRHYNNAIDQLNRKEFAFQNMLSELLDVLPNTNINPIQVNPSLQTSQTSKIGVVTIADLHIGAYVRDLNVTPEFDLNIAKQILAMAADKINSQHFKQVHLAILGDIIETFTGLNHKNSWKSIAYGMYGARVVKVAVELLEFFFSKIVNLSNVYITGGNHDRSTSSNELDDKSEIAELISYILQRIYNGVLDIEYDPLVLSKEIDNINYLFTHGDKKALRITDPRDFVFDYGNSKLFNLILSGHLHSRSIPSDTIKYRWVQCPSIFTGNWYSERNGWSSYPGLLLIKNNGDDLPSISDESINSPKIN